jgi:hypothetical protein
MARAAKLAAEFMMHCNKCILAANAGLAKLFFSPMATHSDWRKPAAFLSAAGLMWRKVQSCFDRFGRAAGAPAAANN